MKKSNLCLLAFLTLSVGIRADDYTVGDIRIQHPWSLALPEVARNGAAYMKISNHGTGTDRLISGSSPIAARVEVHTHKMEGGVMKMRRLEAIEVRPGKPSILQPGELHLMLVGLKEPLTVGKTFPLTLNFERAGSVEVTVKVRESGAAPAGHSGHGKHSGHGG
ncbi:MAG: copper chaperone PCu(A)C [Acidiferrobacterales bacterium]